MLRTQIYLPSNQIKLLKKIAWEEEISLSETIRRLINEKLVKTKRVNNKQNTGSWLLALADKAKKLKIKGPKDLASKMDFYLYGQE
ncbi:ribbon-helix-helix protein, CopG family [Candidatus Microgenomates bacterium]|nr:ribbon-helix-helix protein, CopG family [Candidatus Microgenomates bacterium]